MKQTLLLILINLNIVILSQGNKAFESFLGGSTSTDQYVKIPTPVGSDLRLNNPFTIEMWIYVPTSVSSQVSLLETEYSNYGSTFLRLGADKRVVLWPNGTNGNNPGYNSFPSTSNLTYGVWNHLAISYTDVSGSVSIYINGVLDKQGSFTLPIFIDNQTSNFYLGANGNSKTVQANVKYDEVRIWNGIRTPTEISSNMNSCLTGQETDLIAYYDFENVTDTIIADKSGNNFEGAIVNSGTNSNIVPSTINCNSTPTDIIDLTKQTLNIYPNPVQNELSIKLEKEQINKIEIIDYSGKTIITTNNSTKSIDVSMLKQSIYMLKVYIGKNIYTNRFIKD